MGGLLLLALIAVGLMFRSKGKAVLPGIDEGFVMKPINGVMVPFYGEKKALATLEAWRQVGAKLGGTAFNLAYYTLVSNFPDGVPALQHALISRGLGMVVVAQRHRKGVSGGEVFMVMSVANATQFKMGTEYAVLLYAGADGLTGKLPVWQSPGGLQARKPPPGGFESPPKLEPPGDVPGYEIPPMVEPPPPGQKDPLWDQLDSNMSSADKTLAIALLRDDNASTAALDMGAVASGMAGHPKLAALLRARSAYLKAKRGEGTGKTPPPGVTPEDGPPPVEGGPPDPPKPFEFTIKTGHIPSIIAAYYTGDGNRWKELVTQNPDKLSFGGQYGVIGWTPGTVIILPESWNPRSKPVAPTSGGGSPGAGYVADKTPEKNDDWGGEGFGTQGVSGVGISGTVRRTRKGGKHS